MPAVTPANLSEVLEFKKEMTIRTRQGLLALGAGLAGAAAVAAVLGAQRGVQRDRYRRELVEVNRRIKTAERRMRERETELTDEWGEDPPYGGYPLKYSTPPYLDPGWSRLMEEYEALESRRDALRALTYRSPKGARR